MRVVYANGNRLLPKMYVDRSVISEMCGPWEKAQVVGMLGKKLGYRTMKSKFAYIWRLTADFDLLDVVNGFYMVKFDLKEDKEKVMEGGPWMIFNHYLEVSTWSLEFLSAEAKDQRT